MPGCSARSPTLAALAATLAAAGSSACGGGDATTAADRPATVRATVPAPVRPPRVRTEAVTFRATDGRRVRGVLRRAATAPAPAVLLLHQVDGGAEQWDRFAPVLHRAGFTTLAFGGDGGWDVARLAREARGALRYLRGREDVRRARVMVVGASIGGATALWLSTRLPAREVVATVSLSPAMDSTLLDMQDRESYHPHDVLFVSNAQEAYAIESLREGALRSRSLIDPDGGHGTELLTAPRVADAVVRWLRGAR